MNRGEQFSRRSRQGAMRYSRSASSSSSIPPQMDNVRIKLSRIVSQHEELKIAFFQLNSRVRDGLLEAEDVYASLAVPLMMLVGLKTAEMATEGRFCSIIMNEDIRTHSHHEESSSCNPMKSEDEFRKPEEKIVVRTIAAGKEVLRKQKLQLMQLVNLLKRSEAQVNSSQDDILNTLTDNRASIQKLFQQAVTYVSAVHQSCQTSDMFLIVLKLLKCIFDRVGSALCSVENGVEELMDKLADNMCYPMTNYVNDFKNEIVAGTSPTLVALIEVMAGEMRLRRLEVEELKRKVREAEKSRLEMLGQLKESEELLRKTKEQGLLMEANPIRRQKEKGHQFKDENVLWGVMRRKRKLQAPDSPFVPQELLRIKADDRKQKSSVRLRPGISCKPNLRSSVALLSPQTPKMNMWMPLGTSPSAATQQVIPFKGTSL